jgi:hypothetical protein
MQPIPANPILYEINTWVWLNQLSASSDQPVKLGSVPEEEWARLAHIGVDIVWLMGVWERSPKGLEIAWANPPAIDEFQHALPGFQPADLVGSPYCVHNYVVDAQLGGREGLAVERQKMARHGIRLILDYVPNHVAPDHPWTIDHPEYFVQGDDDDLQNQPYSFIRIRESIIARGKDPNFDPWIDVVQLNAFNPGMRQATIRTLSSIAAQCDGMRVDMAMLLLNRIFSATWGERAGQLPELEFWPQVIARVKQHQPAVLFVAETYWDTEHELHQMGFDYCYDKLLYDFIRDRSYQKIAGHLHADLAYQNKLVRFVENHDERRAVTAFQNGYWRLAALVSATLPGMRMFHQGQFDGFHSHVPVQLGRGPAETPDLQARSFYNQLMGLISTPILKEGIWNLLPIRSVKGTPLKRCLSWSWSYGEEEIIITVNLSRSPVVGIVPPRGKLTLSTRVTDAMTGDDISPDQADIRNGMIRFSLQKWEVRAVRILSDT